MTERKIEQINLCLRLQSKNNEEVRMSHVEQLKLYYYSYLYYPGHFYFLYHISHSAVHNIMLICT